MSTKSCWRNGRLYYYDSARTGAVWPACPEVWSYDDFIGADNTDISARTTGWRGSLPGANDTLIIETTGTSGVCGAAELRSGDADNDHAFLLDGQYEYYGSRSACFETSLYIETQVTAAGLMVGFTDPTGVLNSGPMRLVGTTWTVDINNGAMFVYDTDATTAKIWCAATNDPFTPINTNVVPVAGRPNIFRVELEDNGTSTNARFYIDGVCYGVITNALARTAALTPFVAIGTRTAGAPRYAIVDYVKAWQNRS